MNLTPNRTAAATSSTTKNGRQQQIFLSETLISLTQLMENLAQDADANQKKILRGGSAFMLNSEKRA